MSEAKKSGGMLKGALFVLGVWMFGEIVVRPIVNGIVSKVAKKADGTPLIQL